VSPKHILIYCPVFLPQQSGYAHAFVQLIQTLLNNHIKVDVLTPQEFNEKPDEPFRHPLLTVYRYNPKLNIWALGLFYKYGKLAGRMNELYKHYQYDMVLIETGDEPLLIASLGQNILKKTAIRFHSTSDTEYLFLGKHKKYKLRKFFWKYLAANHIKHLCATNHYHLFYAHKHVLNNAQVQSAHVLTNIIPVSLPYQPRLNKQRKFLMVGRMDEEGYIQKGYQQLLEILPDLSDKFIKTGATLTIVGNGALFAQCAKAIKPYPFVKIIQELQHQEMLKELDETNVVLLPSLYEGVSMFALEALSRGNAVVFSKTGGLTEMVDGNGILIEPGNSDNLKNAIITLLEHTDIESLQKKSIDIIVQRYNRALQFNQFNAIYNSINK
jgi:glycosyltransferase involved in cell wall biosynthesis